MQRKKVLFVITKGNFGGAQRYVYDLATNLPPDQFEPIVACGNKEGSLLLLKLSEKNIRVIELKSLEREIKLSNDLKTVKELIKIIKEEKPDVLHFNSSKIGFLGSLSVLYFKILNLFGIWPAQMTRSGRNLEFGAFFTSHGWAFNEKKRSLFSRAIFYIAHYFTVLVCDTTIAVSEKTKKDIAWLPFIKEKITVVHNGIGRFETATKKEALQILNPNNNRIIIFTLAELHLNKGIDVALRGIALLPAKDREKILYCIAGTGEEKEKLEKLVTDLKLKNIVKFLGFVADGKKLLSGADIFLFPSRTENLPYAILEAGLAGLPIIATSVGGIPEIIDDMRNGILVHKNNPKEIAEAINYLLDHKEKQKEFGSEIKGTITNFFTLEKMLQETIELYKINV